MKEIKGYLQERRLRVEAALERLLPGEGPPRLIEAMRYSLKAGGKRLRPILVLTAAETLGAAEDEVMDGACAVEMVHTYSLIHDDLPAMDDSDLRRGKPSCHCAFGEAIAILAGDALLTLAFETLAGYGRQTGSAAKALAMIDELSAASGVKGMVGGQVLDLETEGRETTPVEIEIMQAMKTGALIKASAMLGAHAAGAGERELRIMAAYAGKLGAAFQIVDDLLDLESTSAELGKPAGADFERAKATLPALIGSEAARNKAAEMHNEAVACLAELPHDTSLLAGLADMLVFRSS